MKFNWILFVSIVAPYLIRLEGLKLINNGYENLYIVIQENVPENDKLLGRIKEIFTDASNLLYRATHKRAYFRSLKVIVPGTWARNDSYKIVSGLTSLTSHIRIGNNEMKEPMTVGSEMCGQEGLYLYLHHQEFVLQEGLTLWGTHDKVIVHEWGHLRWGLRDEYPTIPKPGVGDLIPTNTDGGNVINTSGGDGLTSGTGSGNLNFYLSDGEWKPVSCSRGLDGYASATCRTGQPVGNCDMSDTSVMIGAECKYCPVQTQAYNASLMGLQYLPTVVEFCDKDDDSTPMYMRHNSQAINEQNRDCDGRSAWEVMREHEDFKNGNNPPSGFNYPPAPQIELLQQNVNRVWVFVLDTSGSMAGTRITTLHNAVRYSIQGLFPDGTWLSMIDFDSDAVNLTQFVKLDSNETREQLLPSIPSAGNGGTCIPCGLDLAVDMLKGFKVIDSTEGAEIILISDGENGGGDLNNATENCINAGVVVYSIAVTNVADQRLVDISERTGGRTFTLADTRNVTVTMATILTEIILGGTISNSQTATTVMSDNIPTVSNVPAKVAFNIDDGIGKDTTVTVITTEITNVAINLTGSRGFEETLTESGVQTMSLVVPGFQETGQFLATITTSTSTNVEVIVTSKPLSSDAEVIRPVIRLSNNEFDFRTTSMPIIYAIVRKGESPVKNAKVKALVEDLYGRTTCELDLLDDGIGADVQPGDGIYTAVLIHKCQGGNGRHSSKVTIVGNDETKVAFHPGRRSAIIDDETPITADTPTGSFERVAVSDAYTVSNYTSGLAATDLTPPGQITNLQVIDLHSGLPSSGLTRNYTIVWTATGDDSYIGQASSYEMRISNDQNILRLNFTSARLLNVTGAAMTPNVSGKVERLVMTVSTDDAFTSTTFFAIVAIDDAGNRGPVSNIISITVGLANYFEVTEEECTNNCYSIVKDCGKSLTINNGQVNLTNVLTTAGNTVPVVCDIGYELTGGSTVTCMDDGVWSGVVSCEIVGCGGISIRNGELEFPEGTDYNATAFIKCSDGYHLTGVNTVQCMANGIWDKIGACEINDCGMNETVEHGHIDFTMVDTTYGHTVPVICDTGYRLLGGPSIICMADGKWSKSVHCNPVDCMPTTFANGELDYPTGTKFNATASVTCVAGYHKEGTGIITCSSSGMWSSETQCVINDCGNDFTIPNGFVNFTNKLTIFGESVSIDCNVGYRLSGGDSIRCDNDGNWKTTSVCEIIDCKPTSVANGAVSHESSTTYSSQANVTCDDGYEVEGTGRLVCLETGFWSTDSRCIIKDCGDAFAQPNGFVNFTNKLTVFGETLSIECDVGYKLSGGNSIRCDADGNWKTTVICELIDCKPTSVANGAVNHESSTTYSSRANVTCDDGYEVEGTGHLVCLETGFWSKESGCIIKDCGTAFTIANGQVDFTGPLTTYGQSVPVTCNVGYKRSGGTHVVCLADGTWSDSVTCEKVGCGGASVANGDIEFPYGTDYNAVAIVTCNLGFHLVSEDNKIVCMHSGEWNSSVKCEINDCGSNVTILHGNADFSSSLTTYGHSVPVICDKGYQLRGGTHIQCLPHGSWSKTISCEIVDCGQTTTSNGILDFSEGTKYNARAKLNCDVGFRMTGTGFLTCLETELWSTNSECEIIDCGRDVNITNGSANFTNTATTYGNFVPIVCNTGYKIKGQPNIECRLDGNWSQTPVCELQDCGRDIQIKHGHANFTDRQTTYGESVPIVCDEGFRLNVNEEITCLATGTWGTVPDCVIDESRSAGQQVIIIVASSCGVLFLLVIGLLSLSVVNKVKNMALAKKGHISPTHRKYMQSEASYVEANPDYDMDYQDWNTHFQYTNPVRMGIYLPQRNQANGFLNGFY